MPRDDERIAFVARSLNWRGIMIDDTHRVAWRATLEYNEPTQPLERQELIDVIDLLTGALRKMEE